MRAYHEPNLVKLELLAIPEFDITVRHQLPSPHLKITVWPRRFRDAHDFSERITSGLANRSEMRGLRVVVRPEKESPPVDVTLEMTTDPLGLLAVLSAVQAVVACLLAETP